MIALLLAIVAVLLVVAHDLLKAVLAGELRGVLATRCRQRIDEAASLLPSDLADDFADEWRRELTAYEDQDRLLSAWKFARRLPAGARAMSGTSRSAPVHRVVARAWRWLRNRVTAHDSLEATFFWILRWAILAIAVGAPAIRWALGGSIGFGLISFSLTSTALVLAVLTRLQRM
jgi:hypothetical protein